MSHYVKPRGNIQISTTLVLMAFHKQSLQDPKYMYREHHAIVQIFQIS